MWYIEGVYRCNLIKQNTFLDIVDSLWSGRPQMTVFNVFYLICGGRLIRPTEAARFLLQQHQQDNIICEKCEQQIFFFNIKAFL